MSALYAAAAMAYFDAGWSPLPLPAGQKSPPPKGYTGPDGRTPTRPDVGGWIAEQPDANLGIRLPADVLGIDVDHYGAKRGGDTIADAEAGLGVPLPATWIATSRPGTLSGIRLYRVPEGLSWVSGLPAVDIIRHGHRYVVAWPSVHPEGRQYVWLSPDGSAADRPPTRDELAELPPAWVDYLSRPATSTADGAEVAPEAIEKALDDMPKGKPCEHVLRAAGKAAAGGNRYDGHRDAVLALIGNGRRGCPGAEAVLTNLRASYVAQVTTVGDPPRTRKVAEAEWRRMFLGKGVGAILAEPQREGCPDSLNDWEAYAAAGVPNGTPDPEADQDTDDGTDDQDTDDQADAGTEAPGTSGDPANTWQRQTLDAVLDGTHVPQVGTLMARSDGVCLLYAGLTHSIHAESESGKSLIVQAEAANVLNTGGRVLYLDFESDAVSVTRRLVDLGADREAIRERFDYRAPETAPAAGTPERAEWLALLATPYALVIIDGVTESLALLAPRDTGGDPNERIAGWLKVFPSRIARDTGAAVVLIDHVVKSTENRGRHAIGGQHKLNGLTGAAYTVDVKTQPRRGYIGEVVLRVAKDRPAGIRPHCGPPRSDRTQEAARVIFDSTGDRLQVRLEPPAQLDTDAATERPPFRPTHLMEATSRHLEANPGEHSRSAIEDALTGNRGARRTALDVLTAEGYVTCREEIHGSRTDRRYRHARPYRQTDDPQSDAYLAPDPPNGPNTAPEAETVPDPPNTETPLFPHETADPPNPPQTRPRPAPGESVAAQDTDPPNPPNPLTKGWAGGRVQATAPAADESDAEILDLAEGEVMPPAGEGERVLRGVLSDLGATGAACAGPDRCAAPGCDHGLFGTTEQWPPAEWGGAA